MPKYLVSNDMMSLFQLYFFLRIKLLGHLIYNDSGRISWLLPPLTMSTLSDHLCELNKLLKQSDEMEIG